MESKRRDNYSKEMEAKTSGIPPKSIIAPHKLARSMVMLMKNANLTESDEKYALH
jgi:hypothetical protein